MRSVGESGAAENLISRSTAEPRAEPEVSFLGQQPFHRFLAPIQRAPPAKAAAIDPNGWRKLPALAALAYGAGLLADCVKLLVIRTRPGISELATSAQATFLGWRPLMDLPLAPGQSKSLYQSFPSGHTATAVGLAIGLSLAYPRGRWFFAALAILAASQRIFDGHHFLSDTLAGACIAFGWCGLVLPWVAKRLEAQDTPPVCRLHAAEMEEAA